MELGSLFKDQNWSATRVPADQLTSIIAHLQLKKITSRSARRLLLMKFQGDERPVKDIIASENLTLNPFSKDQYVELARTLVDEKPDMVRDIVEKGQRKKIKWFVGQMMAKSPEGSVEPGTAEAVLTELLTPKHATP
jgi:aspartyl-tRNA(Asn)/glutamyl-tRNA(Gln) amidotransferase subunit B